MDLVLDYSDTEVFGLSIELRLTELQYLHILTNNELLVISFLRDIYLAMLLTSVLVEAMVRLVPSK